MRVLVIFGITALFASGFASGFASRAAAQLGPGVSVSRGAGADDCPDLAALLARIELLRGRPDAGATVRYHVEFTHESAGFRAEIRAEPDTSTDASTGDASTRVLHDQAMTCAGLEQATAVTLALLLDSDARASTKPAATPPAPTPVARVEAIGRNPPEPRAVVGETSADIKISAPDVSSLRRGTHSATFALGAAGAFGVLRPIAPALVAELGLRSDGYRAGLGLLWSPALAVELAPGKVRQSLWSGAARACIAPVLGAELRLDVCSGLYLGSLHASAEGYSQNRGASRLWLALPLELALASTRAPIGWELSAAALVPLRRQDFSIDQVGVAYASLPVGVLVAVRGVGIWQW